VHEVVRRTMTVHGVFEKSLKINEGSLAQGLQS
jgi:hypothetical protein